MNEFLLTTLSFPNVIFTATLSVVAIYWLCVALGLVRIDVLDVLDADGHLHSEHSFAETFANIVLRLGLQGMPVTLAITFITLFGWLISYYLSYVELVLFGYNLVRFVVGVPILVFSLYLGVLITAQLSRLLHQRANTEQQQARKKLLGQIVTVQSSRVDRYFGKASFGDGEVSIILEVRTLDDKVFVYGDRVVLQKYRADQNTYFVVAENKLSAP
jgi:hypothetical protein